MRVEDKLIVFLYILIISAISVAFIIFPFDRGFYQTVVDMIQNEMYDYIWIGFAIAVILLAVSVKLIAGLIGVGSKSRYGIVKNTDEGELFISNDTIKAMVVKVASEARGIKDIVVYIKPEKENLTIMLKASIMPDVNIPETVKQIQMNVKNNIETIAEVPVGEVKVMISGIATSTKLRMQ